MSNYKMYGEERVSFYDKKYGEAKKGLDELGCDVTFFHISFRHRSYILNNDEHLSNEIEHITKEELLQRIEKDGITRFQYGFVKEEYYIHCHVIDNILKNNNIKTIAIVPLYIGYTNAYPPGPKEINKILNNRKKENRNKKITKRRKEEGLYKLVGHYINTLVLLLILRIFKNTYKDYSLISDGKIHAQDNGESFARYLESISYKKYFYVLDKNSKDYKKLKKEIKVVKSGSIKHLIISVNYKYAFVSYYGLENYSYFTREKYNLVGSKVKGKKIFFEHGITYNDHSVYGVHRHNPYVKVDNYLCGAKVEYEALLEKNNLDFIYLGLPRHDLLSNNSRFDNKVMIFFTWRRFLNADCSQEEIDNHFNNLNALLRSDVLKMLNRENKTEVNLFLHKAYFEKSNLINVPDYINVIDFETGNIQHEIATSKLLITDYSSVQFEFIFQDKMVINYQFDRERFFAEHYFPLIDIDKIGLTNVVMDVTEFNEKVKKSYLDDFKISRKQKAINSNFFGRRDNKNCERIFQYYLEEKK